LSARVDLVDAAVAAESGGSQPAREPASAGTAQSTAEAEQWVSRAEAQFQQADYRSAVQSCDAALRIEPGNAKAKQLKAKIEETMRILGKN
jgi:Tfp pilus assembly protein PilF